MILIGVAGLARSGKDTAARFLADELGLYQYAFAEPLKTMLKSVFGDHFHEGDRSGLCPETGKSYRYMMQTLGTETGRLLWNDNVWVNLVGREFEKLKANPYRKGGAFDARLGPGGHKGMILSDVRFDSEAEWIKGNGGVVVQLTRPTLATGTPEVTHASEQGVSRSLINVHIDNSGTVEYLHTQLSSFVEVLKVRPWLRA